MPEVLVDGAEWAVVRPREELAAQLARELIAPWLGNASATPASSAADNRSATTMFKPVRKAVFPVGGQGTRFLPATKAVPKEMLPVVDRPLIQYAVDEALAAGIEQMIFVTARGKAAIEDYFDVAYELDASLKAKGKAAELARARHDPARARPHRLCPPAGARRPRPRGVVRAR